MKNPGKPRIIVKTFNGLKWKNGKLHPKTFDDLMKEIYTPAAIQQLLPMVNPLYAILGVFK